VRAFIYDLYMVLARPPPVSPLFPYTTLFRSSSPSSSFRRTRCASPPERRPRISSAIAGSSRVDSAPRRPQPPAQEAQHDGEAGRSEEHTSELQSRENLVCRLLLEKKK